MKRLPLWLLLALLSVLCPAPPALAQGGGVVTLDLVEFGVGNAFRPGGWVTLRLRVSDASPSPREIMLRANGFDPDGDTPVYETVIAAPGLAGRDAWLSMYLPYDFEPGQAVTVQAFEAEPVQNGPRSHEPGRLLVARGFIPIAPEGGSRAAARPVDQQAAMLGIIGTRAPGIRQYNFSASGTDWPPLGHERIDPVQFGPDSVPDTWIGLAPFEFLVWASDADPTRLGSERASAIRQWVRRGGHLVILLPLDAQLWQDPRSNPIAGLMPDAELRRRDLGEREIRDLLPMLTRAVAPSVSETLQMHEFVPIENGSRTAMIPLLADPSGRVLAARRLVGMGMVSVIGLELDRPQPDADVFWHRILGRRGRIVSSQTEATALQTTQDIRFTSRQQFWLDRDIPDKIAKTGRAAAGLGLGFAVFALYWLVAGPLGYAILRRYNKTQHAWLLYVAAAGLFTVIAWSGAAAIRPSTVEAAHLTILDHVYDQGEQRARSWMSLLVPRYGEARVRVVPDSMDATPNLLTAWQPRERGSTTGFPDTRSYIVDGRRPEEASIPVRSTVKQLQIDRSGQPIRDWGMPRPTVGPDGSSDPALWLDARGLPAGRLVHSLPGVLRDARLIVVRGQRTVGPLGREREDIPADALAFAIGDWRPDSSLDLSELAAQFITTAEDEIDHGLQTWLNGITPRVSATLPGSTTAARPGGDPISRLTAGGFFGLIEPPRYDRATQFAGPELARRWSLHGLDMSLWTTQPSIIVIGHIDGPCPIPLVVGDESPVRPEFSGTTIVRWVYPLSGRPPAWPRP
ncbi:MAG: hypothetical protein JJU33_03955 [Phycisphaerales bacterium]|nr:hypothetical protein [Phycisphaerales bacterium]